MWDWLSGLRGVLTKNNPEAVAVTATSTIRG
jgi:hypothetical protein